MFVPGSYRHLVPERCFPKYEPVALPATRPLALHGFAMQSSAHYAKCSVMQQWHYSPKWAQDGAEQHYQVGQKGGARAQQLGWTCLATRPSAPPH